MITAFVMITQFVQIDLEKDLDPVYDPDLITTLGQ